MTGNHGQGYASAAGILSRSVVSAKPLKAAPSCDEVLQLDPEAPYKRVKIRVKAADEVWTADCQSLLAVFPCPLQLPIAPAFHEVTVNQYLLVVAMTNHRTWAMLESLVRGPVLVLAFTLLFMFVDS